MERRRLLLIAFLLGGCSAPAPTARPDAAPNLTESTDDDSEGLEEEPGDEGSDSAVDTDDRSPQAPKEDEVLEKTRKKKELGAAEDGVEADIATPAQPRQQSQMPPGSCSSIACQTACERYGASLADACAQAYAAGCFEKVRPNPKKCAVPQLAATAKSTGAAGRGNSQPKPAEAPQDDTPSALPKLFGDP